MSKPKKPLSDEAVTLTPAIGCPSAAEVILPERMPDGSRVMSSVVCDPAVAITPVIVFGT